MVEYDPFDDELTDEDMAAIGDEVDLLLAGGFFSYVAWDTEAALWAWVPGSGQAGYVSQARIIAELGRHMDGSLTALRDITRELFLTEVGSAEWGTAVARWEIACAVEIADSHRGFAMFARGGRSQMGAEQWGRVGGHLADEFRWLRRFSEQLSAGQVSEAQALARITQYAQAAQQAYWHEWVKLLPKQKSIYWRLTASAENCGDCAERANNSPYTVEALPGVPGDGSTQCHGNCRCYLEGEQND